MKVGKILHCLKFGSMDDPWVRGGRSAIHEVFHQRLKSVENSSADGPPMDRGWSPDAPVRFGYTGDGSTEEARTVRQGSADGPSVLRKILPEAISVGS